MQETVRDECFMDLLGHLVAMIRPPQSGPMGFAMQSVPPQMYRPPSPMPRPPTTRPPLPVEPYGSINSFSQSHGEFDESD